MRRLFILSLIAATIAAVYGQKQQIVLSSDERPIAEAIKGLRSLPDAQRGPVTKKLALDIRVLPAGENKLMLAENLANLATEGDFGKPTLQEVATTLYGALRERETAANGQMQEEPYLTLAQLVRYEGATVPSGDLLLSTAMTQLEADDQRRRNADFTLNDIGGKPWTLRQLSGKVVLVNFWATWCPPCRKEMPDLDVLYKEFRDKGLIVLAISDEDAAKVNPFIAEHKYSYPILLDPGGKVGKIMSVDGIPKSFVYDRQGKLVAQAIDMRTRGQFLEMLGHAGLK